MWVWADAEGVIKAWREVRSRADSAREGGRGQQQATTAAEGRVSVVFRFILNKSKLVFMFRNNHSSVIKINCVNLNRMMCYVQSNANGSLIRKLQVYPYRHLHLLTRFPYI